MNIKYKEILNTSLVIKGLVFELIDISAKLTYIGWFYGYEVSCDKKIIFALLLRLQFNSIFKFWFLKNSPFSLTDIKVYGVEWNNRSNL